MTTTFISQQHGFAHSVRPACDHQRTVIPGPRLDALRALTGGSLLDLTGPFARLPSCYRGVRTISPSAKILNKNADFLVIGAVSLSRARAKMTNRAAAASAPRTIASFRMAL